MAKQLYKRIWRPPSPTIDHGSYGKLVQKRKLAELREAVLSGNWQQVYSDDSESDSEGTLSTSCTASPRSGRSVGQEQCSFSPRPQDCSRLQQGSNENHHQQQDLDFELALKAAAEKQLAAMHSKLLQEQAHEQQEKLADKHHLEQQHADISKQISHIEERLEELRRSKHELIHQLKVLMSHTSFKGQQPDGAHGSASILGRSSSGALLSPGASGPSRVQHLFSTPQPAPPPPRQQQQQHMDHAQNTSATAAAAAAGPAAALQTPGAGLGDVTSRQGLGGCGVSGRYNNPEQRQQDPHGHEVVGQTSPVVGGSSGAGASGYGGQHSGSRAWQEGRKRPGQQQQQQQRGAAANGAPDSPEEGEALPSPSSKLDARQPLYSSAMEVDLPDGFGPLGLAAPPGAGSSWQQQRHDRAGSRPYWEDGPFGKGDRDEGDRERERERDSKRERGRGRERGPGGGGGVGRGGWW
eukprot:gene12673-12800_t